LGAGNDTILINSGRVGYAKISMAAGDDTLTVLAGVVLSGSADGGSGQNTLDNRSSNASFSSATRWGRTRVTASLAEDGTLVVSGTSSDDNIKVYESYGYVYVASNGTTVPGGRLLASTVKNLSVSTYEGSDLVELSVMKLGLVKVDVGYGGTFDRVRMYDGEVGDFEVNAKDSRKTNVKFYGNAAGQVFVDYGPNAENNSFTVGQNSRTEKLKLRMSRNQDSLHFWHGAYVGTADVHMGNGNDSLFLHGRSTVARGGIHGGEGINTRIGLGFTALLGGRTVTGF
jgi:hypothetical protein